jgi:peptidoglycan/xylan/chitin deacetylase (PgdA/CDA1 family)
MPLKRNTINLGKDLFRSCSGLLSRPLWHLLSHFRGSGTVLCYHRVFPHEDDRFLSTADFSIEPCFFEQHLAYLCSRHNVISMDTLVAALKGEETFPPDAIALTFDDGYSDFKDYALPLLEKYSVPATVYVCSDFLSGRGRLWWHDLDDIVGVGGPIIFSWEGQEYNFNSTGDANRSLVYQQLRSLFIQTDTSLYENLIQTLFNSVGISSELRGSVKMMNWKDIKKLDENSLVTIGAHTQTHSVLSSLNEKRVGEEILNSRLLLEKALNRSVIHFAYPFGTEVEAGKREYTIARNCGLSSAVTLIKKHIFPKQIDLYAIPRFHVPRRASSVNRLRGMISGLELKSLQQFQ